MQRFCTFIFQLQGRSIMAVFLVPGTILALLKGKFMFQRLAHSFLLPLMIVSVAFLVFNSLVDLYMERYGMFLLVAFIIVVGATITSISTKKAFWIPALLIIAITGYINSEEKMIFHYDADLGYRREVNSLQQAIDFIAQRQKPGEQVLSNFPGGYALMPEGGYLKGRKINYRTDKYSGAPYYLLMCDPGATFQIDTAGSSVVFLNDFSDGYAHSRVYFVTGR